MSKMHVLARIGKDVQVKFSPNGIAVANLSLAYSCGKKQEDGNRLTQWVDAVMFGKRAESVAPRLTKGVQVSVHLNDIHIEKYESKNGQGVKMVAIVDELQVLNGQSERTPQQVAQAKPVELADLSDDVPF